MSFETNWDESPHSNSDSYIAGAENTDSMSDVPAATARIPQFELSRPSFSMASSALPLKVNPPATPKATPKAQEKERDVAPAPVNSKPSVGAVKDISSPHELTAFVRIFGRGRIFLTYFIVHRSRHYWRI